MSTFASLLLLASLLALAGIWAWHNIAPVERVEEPEADGLALRWAQVREDFAPEEFELLRRIDRQMAGAEAAVLRDWQDMPYDHEREGL